MNKTRWGMGGTLIAAALLVLSISSDLRGAVPKQIHQAWEWAKRLYPVWTNLLLLALLVALAGAIGFMRWREARHDPGGGKRRKDAELFAVVHTRLDVGTRDFMQSHHFGDPFQDYWRERLSEYRRWAERPEVHFFDARLEQSHQALLAATTKFVEDVASFTGPSSVALEGYSSVLDSRDRKTEELDRLWRQRYKILNEDSDEFTKRTHDFITVGREVLGGDFPVLS